MPLPDTPHMPVYRTVARRLHWLMAGLVVIQIVAGLVMVYEGAEGSLVVRLAEALSLYDGHKLLGLVLLALVVVRLAYRIRVGTPADEPTLEPWQREASHLVHAWIYLLLIVVPLLGWAGVSLYPAVVLFGSFSIPAILSPDRDASAAVLAAHRYGAFALIGLIGAHVGAALYHHYVRGDDVLRRMLPTLRAPRR
jgi:cytochrome b561